ncbi:MAG: hypothetical protein AAGJ40_22635 [Planctomycetota bacterium]
MSSAPIPWQHVRNVLVLFAPIWFGAALLFGVLGIGLAVFRKDSWSVRQALVLRDEATGSVDRLGRFASQTEMKAAQETILDVARNPDVVAAALRDVGPPGGGRVDDWPTRRMTESVRKKGVNVVAPQGSDFGNTELVYLQVTGESPEWAEQFCHAMLDNLFAHMRNVRALRADSIIKELTYSRDLTKQKLEAALERMHAIEVQFGEDLGELRSLNDTLTGDGANRRSTELIDRELQIAELELERLASLRELLLKGLKDPAHLLVSGGDLLKNQPTLQRLKDGLIDAQLKSSEIASLYTVQHPRRRAAIQTELEIKQRMLQETEAAVRAMEPMIALAQDRVSRLLEKKANVDAKLVRIAGVRTNYSKYDAEVKALQEQLATAEAALSDAQASRTAALATNLLSPLGDPQIGDQPEGVSGGLMTLGSSMAGLVFGLGLVFLLAPGQDGVSYGRRFSDQVRGRRESDRAMAQGVAPQPAIPPSGVERRVERRRI